MGARAAAARPADVEALSRYARHAGLAFQIFDDLLDACADGAATGKDANQDTGKSTFGTVMDHRAAEALALERCRQAMAALVHLRRPPHTLAAFLKVIIDGYQRQAGATT
jgi:geranylgeranyl pyrophosphate synthase